MTFIEQPSEELRQGDVLFDWPFPLWNMNAYQLAVEASSGANQRAIMNLIDKGSPSPVVICSHDCEIENSRTRMGLVVAPVTAWPLSALDSDESLDLMNSRVPNSNDAYEYINWFPLNVGGETADWRVADFSALSSVAPPHKIKKLLLGGKRFEMTDQARQEFKEKLAMFFGR